MLSLLCSVLALSSSTDVARVSVDWQSRVGRATPLSYGINLFQAHDPELVASSPYRKGLALMNPVFVRYHSMEVMGDSKTTRQGWVDVKNRRWDEAKILSAINRLPLKSSKIMVNLASWPVWMKLDEGGLPANSSDFADWCAELAKILGKTKKPVTYLELTNERDGQFFVDYRLNGGWGELKDSSKPDRVEAFAKLFVAASRAAKKANPNLLVGGPSAMRADLIPFAERFLSVAGKDVDFYSAHSYASGSKDDNDELIIARTDAMVRDITNLRKEVQTKTGRPIPVFLDEYNISWTWEVRDPRMTNGFSAVFDALVMFGAARAGVEGTAAWNECDNIYGKMTSEGEIRPSAELFSSLNRFGVGQLCKATSNNVSVVPYAVKRRTGRAIWVVNRSGKSCQVSGLPNGRWAFIGRDEKAVTQGLLLLPPYSVAWLQRD